MTEPKKINISLGVEDALALLDQKVAALTQLELVNRGLTRMLRDAEAKLAEREKDREAAAAKREA